MSTSKFIISVVLLTWGCRKYLGCWDLPWGGEPYGRHVLWRFTEQDTEIAMEYKRAETLSTCLSNLSLISHLGELEGPILSVGNGHSSHSLQALRWTDKLSSLSDKSGKGPGWSTPQQDPCSSQTKPCLVVKWVLPTGIRKVFPYRKQHSTRLVWGKRALAPTLGQETKPRAR